MSCSRSLILPGVVLVIFAAGSCYTSINSPINVEAGGTREGDLSSVNGSITIGRSCVIQGECRSVNGSVEIGDGSRVQGLSTVNGSIECGRDVLVETNVESINGTLSLEAGSRVDGGIKTINGSIELAQTSVARDVRTVNGNVRLRERSVVAGDLIVTKVRGSRRRRPLEIELEGGSVIEGDLIVEDPSIEVRVLLSGGSEVRGRVENAKVITRDI